MGRRLVRLLLGVALLVSLAGCMTAPPGRSAPGPGGLSIEADRPESVLGMPLGLRVYGADPEATVTIRAEAVDAAGKRWASEAAFKADRHGKVDLTTAAPVEGDYQGPASMGLLWALRPPAGGFYAVPRDGQVVTLRAISGGRTATLTVRRLRQAPGVSSRRLTLEHDGLVGVYHTPARRPAGPGLLLFGGSSGGMASADLLAAVLASNGYRALALAYFGETGLPATLSAIPLEYFDKALAWLARQPGVRADRLVVGGWSRGSEAALLLGVRHPDAVRGVIALVPNNAALCAYPGCGGPAWTAGGQAVPFTNQFNTPYPTDVPAAVIPVERIDGPLFLACGEHDQVWASCDFQRTIAKRRAATRDADVILTFPQAGHGVAFPIPYLPVADTTAVQGATPEANELAREQIWPKLLRYLNAIAQA